METGPLFYLLSRGFALRPPESLLPLDESPDEPPVLLLGGVVLVTDGVEVSRGALYPSRVTFPRERFGRSITTMVPPPQYPPPPHVG